MTPFEGCVFSYVQFILENYLEALEEVRHILCCVEEMESDLAVCTAFLPDSE